MKYILAFSLALVAFATTAAVRADDFATRYPEVASVDCSFSPGKHDKCAQLAQTVSPTPVPSSTTTTTVVNGGTLAAQVIEWLKVAFGTVLAGMGTLAIVRIRAYFGVLTTDAQKAALQEIAVNGVNAAASKAEDALKANPNLSIDVKDAVVADAIGYVQAHGAETIKALGMDPKSGDAVEAIRARVATAMNSPATPTVTATSVTPAAGA